jgi:thymidylate synthase (FAD)
MKLIKPSFEILEQAPGIQGVKKQIELAGRTCYKSEDKITDTSCEEFVNRMVNSGHGAMLEHGTVYLYRTFESKEECMYSDFTLNYHENPFSKVVRVRDDMANPKGKQHLYITTNYRVLVENGWLDDLQYLCEPTKYHEKRITVKFICDRGVSHEFVRHRVFSFAQESTRYCNYSKDKFGNEITCILPPWELDGSYLEFEEDLKVLESIYFKWLKKGWKAQEARYFLPTGAKTELVMTGFALDWLHFFQLRCHSAAHPQARELAVPLKEEFIKKGYING